MAAKGMIEPFEPKQVRFNDEFADIESVNIKQVKGSLEQLALVLGTRFELEDDILLLRNL